MAARNRAAGSSKAVGRINFRVTAEQREDLERQAEGKMTISELARARLFAGGVSNSAALRQVAALHVLGLEVRALRESPHVSPLKIDAVLSEIRGVIGQLARQLP